MAHMYHNDGRHLYEIDPHTGIVSELSMFSCGIAPNGGALVCAQNTSEALMLYFAYLEGRLPKQTLYGFKFPNSHDYRPYPIENVIFR